MSAGILPSDTAHIFIRTMQVAMNNRQRHGTQGTTIRVPHSKRETMKLSIRHNEQVWHMVQMPNEVWHFKMNSSRGETRRSFQGNHYMDIKYIVMNNLCDDLRMRDINRT